MTIDPKLFCVRVGDFRHDLDAFNRDLSAEGASKQDPSWIEQKLQRLCQEFLEIQKNAETLEKDIDKCPESSRLELVTRLSSCLADIKPMYRGVENLALTFWPWLSVRGVSLVGEKVSSNSLVLEIYEEVAAALKEKGLIPSQCVQKPEHLCALKLLQDRGLLPFKELLGKVHEVRKIRGDGNCFFTGFTVRFLETLIEQNSWESFIAMIEKDELKSFGNLGEKIVALMAPLRNSNSSDWLKKVLSSNTDMRVFISCFRRLAGRYFSKNEGLQELHNDDRLVRAELNGMLRMGFDAEHVGIQALHQATGLCIRIYDAKHGVENFFSFGEGSPHVVLCLRGEHYFVLYMKPGLGGEESPNRLFGALDGSRNPSAPQCDDVVTLSVVEEPTKLPTAPSAVYQGHNGIQGTLTYGNYGLRQLSQTLCNLLRIE